MATAKKADTTPDPAPASAPDVTADGSVIGVSQWEFLDRAPTTAEVVALLETLPDVYGVPLVEAADYVQALPQKKRVKRVHPQKPDVTYDANITAYTLYMGVAGRLFLLQRIAEKNGWSVEFQPEPKTPTGIPGLIIMDERLVYREYLVVYSTDGDTPDQMMPLGRRPGTAWVPARDGKNAAGTNPFEKVETSARGRAIAAWGIGVLPGSGVASLEEIQNANQIAAGQRNQPAAAPSGRRSPEQLAADVRGLSEQLRQMRDKPVDEWNDQIAARLAQIGAPLPDREPGSDIPFEGLRSGHLQMLANDFQSTRDRLVAAGETEA